MSVSVSRIGQSFDRSASRLVDQSRLLGQPLDQSFCVCLSVPVHTCAHHPFAPPARSGLPNLLPRTYYRHVYAIHICILLYTHDASLLLSSPPPFTRLVLEEKSQRTTTHLLERIHPLYACATPFSTYGGRRAWSRLTTFNP